MTFRGDANFDTTSVSRGGGGGRGGGAIAIGGGGILTVILVIVSMIFGVDLTGLAPGQPIDPQSQTQSGEEITGCTGEQANDPANIDCRMEGGADSMSQFWETTFAANSLEYRDPTVQLFDRQVETGCGGATSAVGPFYCPPDERIYLDTTFFQQMRDQFGASGGSLAQLYVLAHEWGHHIQNVTGDLQRVQQGDTGPQSTGVRSELQADCYAGAWMAAASQTADDDGSAPILVAPTQQEMNDALNAAAAIGDDRLQQMGGGGVNPEGWTHGSSEQRQTWLTTGYNEGVGACNTWSAPQV
jgi:uncharacterized protein